MKGRCKGCVRQHCSFDGERDTIRSTGLRALKNTVRRT